MARTMMISRRTKDALRCCEYRQLGEHHDSVPDLSLVFFGVPRIKKKKTSGYAAYDGFLYPLELDEA